MPKETYEYDAYFYHGVDRRQEKHLGRVRGISACQYTAHREGARMGLHWTDYDYICCWVSQGSECLEKHR